MEQAGHSISSYTAAEINPRVSAFVAQKYPGVRQFTDVTKITDDEYHELGAVDLLLGGSPCQSFSNAGRGAGFDGKSGLFWEYVRALRTVQPKWFLFENVVMRKEWADVISDALGVQPVKINSSSFVPHNRPRLYWTNIPLTHAPPTAQCSLTLGGILEQDVDPSYYLTEIQLSKLDLNYNWSKGAIKRHKAGRHQQDQIQHHAGIAGCLAASHHGAARHLTKTLVPDGRIRRLTEVEAERLQGLPDGYTAGLSSSVRYEALGNGWTVPVISWFLSQIPRS